jgi:hypothetical protein
MPPCQGSSSFTESWVHIIWCLLPRSFLCTLCQMCRSNCGAYQVNGSWFPCHTWYLLWQLHHYYFLNRHHRYTYVILSLCRSDSYSAVLELLNALQKYATKILFLAHRTVECSVFYRQTCHSVEMSLHILWPQMSSHLPSTDKDILLSM